MRTKRFVPMFIVLAIIALQPVAEAKPPKVDAKPAVEAEEEYLGCYEPQLTQKVREAFPRWYEQNVRTIVESIVKARASDDWHNNKFGYIVFATKNKMVAAECVAMPGDVTKVNKNLEAGMDSVGCLGQVHMNGVLYFDLPNSLTTQWMRVAAEVLVRSDIDFVNPENNVEEAMRNPKFNEVLATAKFGLTLYSQIPKGWTAAARELKCSQIKDSILTVSSDGKFTLVPAPPKKEAKRK